MLHNEHFVTNRYLPIVLGARLLAFTAGAHPHHMPMKVELSRPLVSCASVQSQTRPAHTPFWNRADNEGLEGIAQAQHNGCEVVTMGHNTGGMR